MTTIRHILSSKNCKTTTQRGDKSKKRHEMTAKRQRCDDKQMQNDCKETVHRIPLSDNPPPTAGSKYAKKL